MDELAKQIQTPTFWIGTVVVGILVNFLSQFLYPRLGALPGLLGAWRRRRSSAKAQRFEAVVAAAIREDSILLHLVAQETRLRQETCELLALATVSYVCLFGLLALPHPNLLLVAALGVGGLFVLVAAKLASSAASRYQEAITVARDAAYSAASLPAPRNGLSL